MTKKPLTPNPVEALILSKLNMLADEIKDLEEKLQAAAKEPAKPKTKKKTRKKNITMENNSRRRNEMQGEIK